MRKWPLTCVYVSVVPAVLDELQAPFVASSSLVQLNLLVPAGPIGGHWATSRHREAVGFWNSPSGESRRQSSVESFGDLSGQSGGETAGDRVLCLPLGSGSG